MQAAVFEIEEKVKNTYRGSDPMFELLRLFDVRGIAEQKAPEKMMMAWLSTMDPRRARFSRATLSGRADETSSAKRSWLKPGRRRGSTKVMRTSDFVVPNALTL